MTPATTPEVHFSEACRHIYDAEARIARQQKLAEKLERQGFAQAARQAREMLAMFVRSYFVMHHRRQTLERELDHSPSLATFDPEICSPPQRRNLAPSFSQQLPNSV